MASFDFVDAAAKGYEFTWRERGYLFRVALPVIFVKIACVLMIFALGIQDQHLLNGLIAMPGYIIEGIFIVGLVRFVLYREDIFVAGRMIPAPVIDKKPLVYTGVMTRWECLQAGFAMYMLIKIIQLAFDGWVADALVLDDNVQPEPLPDPTFYHAILVLSLLWLALWAFRLVWLYIPVALGHRPGAFLKRIAGFNISLSIFATWFICFLPLVVLVGGFFNAASMLAEEETLARKFLFALLETVGELLLIVVQVAGITYGFSEVIFGKQTEK